MALATPVIYKLFDKDLVEPPNYAFTCKWLLNSTGAGKQGANIPPSGHLTLQNVSMKLSKHLFHQRLGQMYMTNVLGTLFGTFRHPNFLLCGFKGNLSDLFAMI